VQNTEVAGSAESCYFGTLQLVSHDDAIKPMAGTSIASQVKHVLFILHVANELLSGRPYSPGADAWEQSFELESLSKSRWDDMSQSLRCQYANLRDLIEQSSLEDESLLGHAVGTIAHLAYHLGAIRCKVRGLCDLRG
jgi:hypothetical protein